MKITDMKRNKGGMYSVWLDNEYAFDVPEYEVFKLGIYVDRELDMKELDLIKNQVLISLAKSEAIKYICYKMRTTYEVEIKLKDKYSIEVIEEIIDYLKKNAYLDDELYAEKYILEKKKLGKLSKQALVYKLVEKGINKDIIYRKLDESEYEENTYAEKIAKRMRKTEGKDEELKIKSCLYRKGFSKETIDSVLNEENNKH